MGQQSSVHIRPTEDSDIPSVISIERIPAYGGLIEEWSEGQHKEAIASKDMDHFVIRGKDSGQIVGYMIFAKDSKNLSMMFRRIAVAKQGSGLGKAGVVHALEHCFETLGFHRLWLNVREDNVGAIALYEKAGFIAEGVSRDAIRVGGDRFKSYVVMSILRHEYESGK